MQKKQTHLWIGGSSGLARTYFNTFPDETWLALGLEHMAPSWLPPNVNYLTCDLTLLSNLEDARLFWNQMREAAEIEQVIVSVRPPLVTPRTNQRAGVYNHDMLEGLKFLLLAMKTQSNLKKIVHVSSIAAVDHLKRQHQWSVDTNSDPNSIDLAQPYDRFKRACEEMIADQFMNTKSEVTNLRFGAIFSDTPDCIQCQAMALQAWIGPSFMPVPIDCNSSFNASHLIHCVLSKQQNLRPVYFYTRPLSYRSPVPYGSYLRDYRKAHDITRFVPIPMWLVEAVVVFVHLLALRCGDWAPYLQSIDYLLQVTKDEHSFATDAVEEDFPELLTLEENIERCFRRRRQVLRQAKKTSKAL